MEISSSQGTDAAAKTLPPVNLHRPLRGKSSAPAAAGMLIQDLAAGWSVQAVSNRDEVPANIRDRDVPSAVPGCVHTDLLRAGLIEDPYLGFNEKNVQWIGRTDWQFRTTFTADAAMLECQHIELVCDGLDTVASLELNGNRVGEAANMHHAHRFDSKRFLMPGRNELTITFRSALHHAREMEKRLGSLPYLNGQGGPFPFVRKMACNFGWDWGPALITCGIWKGIRLEGWETQRLISVRPHFLHHRQGASELRVMVDLTGGNADPVEAWLIAPDGRRLAASAVEDASGGVCCVFKLIDPRLWWPLGHGEQPLYTLELSVAGTQHRLRLGLREVELDAGLDEVGRAFTLKINGKPIFCKGFNWIPDDCFLDRACTSQRYRQRIGQVIDANANMLRVWGGGIYETDEFYDICDELGLLVWQDFLFACAAYPEEEPLRSSVEAEARYNVARLCPHPSLVLWNGCNENLWGYWDWGWKQDGKLQGRTWGAGYYLDMFPGIVASMDPSRPYWAASPWSGDPDLENGLHPNLASHGNKHIWEVWHGPGDYNNYRWFTPRFCSEFGYQGPPAYATWARALPPAELRRGSAGLEQHQKSDGGNARNDRLLLKDFELPDNFDDWQYLLQINQARALTTACEWFRSRTPVCMGTLYWQFNDCWPVSSWSAIDGDGRPKPLWYATRRFYAPRLLTIQPVEDHYQLCAINDSDEPWMGTAQIAIGHLHGGERRAAATVEFEIRPRGVFRSPIIAAPFLRPRDKSLEFLVAQSGVHRAIWFYESDRQLAYPQPTFTASLERVPEGYRLTLRAASFLRDLCVFIDRLDPEATISDQAITLLPGDSCVLNIRTKQGMSLDQLTSPPVLQCVNRFGRKSRP